MSQTKEWVNRYNNRHWSQDERALSSKFQKEVDTKIDDFLGARENSLLLGEFNLDQEPWRVLALNDFKKYNLKIFADGNKLYLVKK